MAVMRAAFLRKSLGESFSERVSEAAGVTVSIKTKERHVQGDERLNKMKVYHKLVSTKRLRQRRKANRKKLEWKERAAPEGYRKGMALDPPANGERGEEEEGGEGGGGDDDDDDGDGSGGGGGGGGDGGGGDCDGDDESDEEIEEEEIEEEEPLHCVLCRGSHTEADDVMLLCCDVKCGHAAHRSCASKRYQTPRNTRNPDGPAASAVNWKCCVCQYMEEIASVEEVGGARAVDEDHI